VPIVTVSRQFGSGGSAVAAIIAEQLGWRLLDNAIIDEVAREMGVSPDRVRALDEQQPPLITRLADTLTLGSSELISPNAGDAAVAADARMIEATRLVMEAAVRDGPVVVVGRGAQVVLGQRADALHVFCYAPREHLVQRVARREGLTETEAARRVDHVNAQRRATAMRHWGRDWGAVENYHISLNTGFLGIEGAASVIVAAAKSILLHAVPT